MQYHILGTPQTLGKVFTYLKQNKTKKPTLKFIAQCYDLHIFYRKYNDDSV